MLKLRAVFAVLLALALNPAGASAQAAAPANFRDEFLGQFNNSMEKLIALAKAIPEDRYNWSPGPGVMPVSQVYAHIARYNYLYPQANMGVKAPAGVDVENLEKTSGKAQIVDLLERSAAHVRTSVSQMPEGQLSQPTRLYGRDVPQWAVLFQLLAHMNEHVGQSIAYARMNNIVPPWAQ